MKILIIRPGALGDTLMVAPSLVALRGKVEITFVGRRPGLDFIKDHVDRVLDLEGPGWHRLFRDNTDPIGLPVSHADTIIAFFSDTDGVIYRNLRTYFHNSSVYVFPSFPLKTQPMHAAYYIAKCFESTGFPIHPEACIDGVLKNPVLMVNKSHFNRRKKIVFHPGSGDPKKNYSPDFWGILIRKLVSRLGAKFGRSVLLFGPAEVSLQPSFKDEFDSSDMEILFSPEKEILSRTLKEAALCLGHDSGIAHLSAMLGTPTIALFKESDPIQWKPLGPAVKVINHEISDSVLVEKVLEAARSLMPVTN